MPELFRELAAPLFCLIKLLKSWGKIVVSSSLDYIQTLGSEFIHRYLYKLFVYLRTLSMSEKVPLMFFEETCGQIL